MKDLEMLQYKVKYSKFNICDPIIINKEITTKGIIIPNASEDGEIISPIFLREKPDGTFRLVEYQHLKMDTFATALHLMTKNWLWHP